MRQTHWKGRLRTYPQRRSERPAWDLLGCCVNGPTGAGKRRGGRQGGGRTLGEGRQGRPGAGSGAPSLRRLGFCLRDARPRSGLDPPMWLPSLLRARQHDNPRPYCCPNGIGTGDGPPTAERRAPALPDRAVRANFPYRCPIPKWAIPDWQVSKISGPPCVTNLHSGGPESKPQDAPEGISTDPPSRQGHPAADPDRWRCLVAGLDRSPRTAGVAHAIHSHRELSSGVAESILDRV